MKISAEMKAAIDKAVSEGRVTRVETGAKTDPEPIRRGPGPIRNEGAILAKAERQRRVREMTEAGKTIAEMAKETGVSVATITNDKKALGLTTGAAAPASRAPRVRENPVTEAPVAAPVGEMDSSLLRYIAQGELEQIKAKVSKQIDGLLALSGQIQRELDRRAK